MGNIELLAPAKDKETAFAAIDCGADAIYMGAPAFGARKNAPNSLEDIKEVVDYAHKYWAKVHITLNTILTDSELEEAVKLANQLRDIGVDALIIQDMGLLKRLMDSGYDLPLHMSTQCDNYLPQKVKFFNDIGVTRVILARELSIEQIKNIHAENPDLELECFIHGALCVSMSGQCYLSQHIGGRSANRGECAQPCRKKYDIIDDKGNTIAKDTYPLCLKDFNGSKYIDELISAGICSFKIEGRLKDVNYVKNIVSYYRNLIGKGSSSGRSSYPFTPNPEKTFNRGFTDYFLNGRTDCFNPESPKSKGEYIGKVTEVNEKWFKIKTEIQLHNGDGLYFNDNGCFVNKVENNKLYPNHKVNLKPGDKVYRNFDIEFEKEISKPVKRQIGVGVNIGVNIEDKLSLPSQGGPDEGSLYFAVYPSLPPLTRGGTKSPLSSPNQEIDLSIQKTVSVLVQLTDEDGVTICAEVTGEPANNPEKMKETFIKQFSKTGESDFYINNINIDTNLPFLPVSLINQLRRDSFEELSLKRIEVYNQNKLKQKPMNYTKFYLDEVDYRANIHNSSAELFYEECGSRISEYSFETRKPNRQIELMKCKHCIKYELNRCKSKENLALRDSHGIVYPLKFNCKDCEMIVLSPD